MDDMATLTTTMPCTRQLLKKLQENIEWAQMKIKPSKSRSISVVKGNLSEQRFYIGEEPIPTVSEKPVKSLGGWYDAKLRDRDQVDQIRQDTICSLESIDKSLLWLKSRIPPGPQNSICGLEGLRAEGDTPGTPDVANEPSGGVVGLSLKNQRRRVPT